MSPYVSIGQDGQSDGKKFERKKRGQFRYGKKSKKQNAQATRTHSQQKYACPS
jgi:hypothetical protein